MIRGLIFVLALAGPAMAEQPTHELGVQCTVKAFETRGNNEVFLKAFERCMLDNGFKFRADDQDCAANLNSPDLDKFFTGTSSLLKEVCYERIR
jgi:hypothetical protein